MINIWPYLVLSFSALMLTQQVCVAANDDDAELSHTVIYPDSETDPDSEPLSAPVKKSQIIASAEQLETIQYYEKLILELESSGGVYQNQLSEVLSSLGTTYQSIDQHEAAIDVFQRSLHITRVNDGLYGLNQIPMLEKLIESNSKLRDWDNLDKNYHNLYWISKRHYGDNNPELLALIDRIGRWHLQAYELEPGPESFSHLINAESLYNKSVEILQLHSGKYDIRLINALYGIALTNYQIAAQVSNAENFDDIRAGYRESSEARRMLQEERARQDLIMHSYTKGKVAMNQIVDIHANNPILPVDTQAMAMTHLGDWYLLFNKRNSAAETYEQAYQLLQNDGMDPEKIDRLFGQPRTLPAIHLPVQNKEDLLPENPSYVLASFDVSSSGKAQNIQIIESEPEDNESYLRRAKRSIAATKFRPRFENGKPVETTGVSLRYVFTD
ncbi:MAG: hypothetical protein ACI9SC_000076 [Gammaproteobacteria bacterium]|jgi:hypothetical protein